MKSRIQFFKDSQFKSEDSEAAAIFSILMDTEFKQHNQAKNDFLKMRLIIAGVLALVGLVLLFIPMYLVSIAFLAAAAGAAFYFYRQYQEMELPKYIDRMGKFHWKISLFPFRDGCVAIDDSGFHETMELHYPFIADEDNDSISAQRQEFSRMTVNQDLFLDELDNGDDSKPIAYYGIEKRIKEILENSHDVLDQPNEKSVTGPLMPATSAIDSNIIGILKTLEPYSEESPNDIISIQEHDATEIYESLAELDTFLNQNKEAGLAETLDGWIDELKEYLAKRDSNTSYKALNDFREEFLSHCDSPGYNHYCPECNKAGDGDSGGSLSISFDENSRMFLKLPGKWQCPVCGHSTTDPIKIPRVYDEVIYPVTRLLLLDEKNKSLQENLLNQILSPEFDHRLKHKKASGIDTFSRVFDEADQALIQTKTARYIELVQALEQSITGILGKRVQVDESLDTFKVDLSIPSPIQIFLPFYLVKYGGEEGNQSLQFITPSSLARSRGSESAVNYQFEQDTIYHSFRDVIHQRMSSLLNDKKYRIEAIKDQKKISRGMQKIKDTDFYSEQRDQFFDFIDKTYFQAQEN